MIDKGYSSSLSKLLAGLYQVPAALDTVIQGITLDSRQVQQGDLFIALAGANYAADAHLKDALARGANAILVEGERDSGKVHESDNVVELYLPNLRDLVGEIADRFFKQPSQDLRVLGVTGTNGKTSVSAYCGQLLVANGVKAGVIGTLGYGLIAEGEALTPLAHTTPNVVEVHRYLAKMRDSYAQVVLMEVSSHGLVQGRVDCVRFEGAIFTNLSRDHLDYHGTMAAYGEAKAKLFTRPELKFAVLNSDDAYSQNLRQAMVATNYDGDIKVLAYGTQEGADLKASELNISRGLEALLSFDGERCQLTSALAGPFNLLNLLAAGASALGLGLGFGALKKLAQVQSVPGRMNILRSEGQPCVVVDYAHTPDALENILESVRLHQPKRMVLVFGCGGDRDTGKRPLMAQVAEQWADQVIVTDDNPRSEQASAITDDIMAGFAEPEKVSLIHDRALAIAHAVELAQPDDWVVIAGKGHEDYQEINGVRSHFSDLEQSRAALGLNAAEPSL